MAQSNLQLAIEKLIYGEVKVCGVKNLAQAQMISAFPVAYLGLIRVESSPRFIALDDAIEISQALDNALVGVYQNQAIDTVVKEALEIGLSAIQLHGDEDEAYILELKNKLSMSQVDSSNSNAKPFKFGRRLVLHTRPI